MNDDLHDLISAAVEAREQIAKRATGPRWQSNGSWEIRTPPSGSALKNPDGPDWYQIMVAPESVGQDIHEFKQRLWANATHIAANDPFTILRHCARDRKVLWRHVRDEHVPTLCFWCSEDGFDPISIKYPCIEIRDLAELYDILVETETVVDDGSEVGPEYDSREPLMPPKKYDYETEGLGGT